MIAYEAVRRDTDAMRRREEIERLLNQVIQQAVDSVAAPLQRLGYGGARIDWRIYPLAPEAVIAITASRRP